MGHRVGCDWSNLAAAVNNLQIHLIFFKDRDEEELTLTNIIFATIGGKIWVIKPTNPNS